VAAHGTPATWQFGLHTGVAVQGTTVVDDRNTPGCYGLALHMVLHGFWRWPVTACPTVWLRALLKCGRVGLKPTMHSGADLGGWEAAAPS
jgi:hypothetical protein